MDQNINPMLEESKKKKSAATKQLEEERKRIFQERMQKTFKGPFEPKPEDMKPIEDEPSAFNIIRPVVPPRDPEALTNETKLSFKAVSQAVNAMTIMKNMLKTKLHLQRTQQRYQLKNQVKRNFSATLIPCFANTNKLNWNWRWRKWN